MAAPTGNKFWMLRSKHGRDKLFSTPELLWEAACEYFQWCDENPWLSKKAIQKTVPVRRKKGKKVETVNEQQVQQEVSPTSRPYSLTGFCIYVGASSKWWSTFRSECRNKNDEDFWRSSHAWRKPSKRSSLRERALELSMRISLPVNLDFPTNKRWTIRMQEKSSKDLNFYHIQKMRRKSSNGI